MTADRPPAFWSAEALNDIDRLWDYYAELAGRATADKVLRGIASVVSTIGAFPHAGRSRDEIRAGLRSLAVDPHVVFYRLAHEQPEIVRVIDGRQDIGEIFPEDA